MTTKIHKYWHTN